MSRSKTVVIEKDGVRGVATEQTFAGLAKRGWTVVDDGDKDQKKAVNERKQTVEKIEQQEQKLFGSDTKE